MKKLPMITQRKKPDARMLTMFSLVALMLAVTFWGRTAAQPAAVTLPVERVPLETAFPTQEAEMDSAAQGAEEPTAQPAAESAFSAYRETLENTRAVSVRMLDEAAASADAETAAQALSEKAALALAMEQEARVETLLVARGFGEALCTVSANAVDVVVRAETLGEAEAAAILELAARETGKEASQIRVTWEK